LSVVAAEVQWTWRDMAASRMKGPLTYAVEPGLGVVDTRALEEVEDLDRGHVRPELAQAGQFSWMIGMPRRNDGSLQSIAQSSDP
jgi:hypothetical protein